MGLFTLHNYCVPFLFDYLITYFEFKSRLPIPEFSGYHCTRTSLSSIYSNYARFMQQTWAEWSYVGLKFQKLGRIGVTPLL